MNNEDKFKMLEIDELDLMLAKELELSARQSNRALAKKLGVSKTTIQRRVQRLVDDEIVTIVTISNPGALGFNASVAIGLNVSPGKAEEVAKYLRSNSRVGYIAITTGRFDLLINVILHNNLNLIQFLDGDLSYVPHLLRMETMAVVKSTKVSWKYLNDDTDLYRHPPCHSLDELDLRLIKELELSPSKSVVKLGEKLGVNRKIVSRRLQLLFANNVVQVVGIADPSFFGYNEQAIIFVRAQPGQIVSLANCLANEKRIRTISITTGAFGIIMAAIFRDKKEESDFLLNRLGSYPGIISHETMIQVSVVKNSFLLLT